MELTAGSSIRIATPDDAATVGRLLFEFNAEFESPTPSASTLSDRFFDLLERDDALVHLAMDGLNAVGFAFCTLRPTPYYAATLAQLEELFVIPSRRAQNVGTKLLTEVVARLRQRGAAEIHINVDEDDHDTRGLYERHGFSNVLPDTECRMLCHHASSRVATRK